jgi:murein hydrolase activator
METIVARMVRLLAVGTLLASAADTAAAEAPRQPPAAAAEALTPERLAEKAAEKLARENELKAIEDNLRANKEARAKLDAEIAAIRSDRAKLNGALIETTQKVRDAETRITAIEERLSLLNASTAAIRRSFESRRAVIVEVLAALQRMGRRPPPAVLVRPEDMLEAVRSSILLGAVIPELRAEADTLAGDLAELVRLGDSINAERQSLRSDLATLVTQRERLASLVAARQERLAEVERNAGDDGAKTAALALQAQSLKELVLRMESEIATGQRVTEEARKAAEAQAKETRDKLAALAFKDPARLAPKISFSETRGLLPLPVGGAMVRSFGAPDGFGGKSQGILLGARPGAIVSAPCDGWVSFAGSFRSFGQLLIINAGGGYYVLLAGMERINVGLGQFVLAGEPVAVMGEATAQASVALGGGSGGPVLYVEFRKDGGSIDPSPWWVKSQGEKVRG